jgi:hypothetical protein
MQWSVVDVRDSKIVQEIAFNVLCMQQNNFPELAVGDYGVGACRLAA